MAKDYWSSIAEPALRVLENTAQSTEGFARFMRADPEVGQTPMIVHSARKGMAKARAIREAIQLIRDAHPDCSDDA